MAEDQEFVLPTMEQRPLVTFALFAYNQEKYIREAVEGAFAQTYEPLEIILSDDCSTDRTFEIMKEMAAEYCGPHRVLARKTSSNRRPYAHVLEVAAIAGGNLIVLAAGDDISKPHRSEQLFKAWTRTAAWALHSKYDLIEEDSRVTAVSRRSEDLFVEKSDFHRFFFLEDGPVYVIHGATSAYDRRLIHLAPKDDSGILSEDGAFSIILNALEKQACFLDESLVFYRQHSAAISNRATKNRKLSISESKKLLSKEIEYSKNIVNRSRLALGLMKNKDAFRRRMCDKSISEEIMLHRAKSEWSELTLSERIKSTKIAVQRRRLGFIFPSILGRSIGAFYLSIRSIF